ncbi:expressed unknown protein [Seminavis robusta]|uniref:Uncharacterized protein n=1 Tax=Seminavis robusta TaxID=568900 RepID=A0A9N8D7Y8_9STRA|nr:expressed unknown protein [Seminavis robusta]|eukprot:Sro11_g008510.1 n/a (357) ;mRNA; f:72936-74006
MRAYIPRKRKTTKKSPVMGPLIPPAAAKLPPPPVLEEEESDFYIPDGDDAFLTFDEKTPEPDHYHSHTNNHHHHHHHAVTHSTSTSSLLLAPIDEQQPDSADRAVAILENFFFGGCTMPKPTLKAVSSTAAVASWEGDSSSINSCPVESSPSCVSQLPVCSCEQKYLFTGLHNVTQSQQDVEQQSPNSLRRSSSCSPKPKKASLKKLNSANSLNSSKRNVSFTEISVREYDVELSDHPSCSFGPPIQLGWDYQEKETVPVEDYEVTRSPQRREVHELVLSYNARRRRLKQSGYKKKEIKTMEKEVDRIKRERLVTEFFLPASAIDETFERVFVGIRELWRPKKRRDSSCEVHHGLY